MHRCFVSKQKRVALKIQVSFEVTEGKKKRSDIIYLSSLISQVLYCI